MCFINHQPLLLAHKYTWAVVLLMSASTLCVLYLYIGWDMHVFLHLHINMLIRLYSIVAFA